MRISERTYVHEDTVCQTHLHCTAAVNLQLPNHTVKVLLFLRCRFFCRPFRRLTSFRALRE